MVEMSELTHEQEVEAVMGIFGVDKSTAEALVARNHGVSAGDYVAVDESGNESAPREVLRPRRNPAA
jgi:hypothetical protein